MNGFILKHANIIGADGIVYNTDIKICEGKIADIGIFDEEGIDCTNRYVSPGFVDIHTHGGYGYDFMDCTQEAFDNILRFHLDNGTTTVLPTSVTAPVAAVRRFIETARTYIRHKLPYAKICGVHLEGPYLSLKNKGAQKEEYLLNPQRDDYSFILDNKDIVRTVTIAPELDTDGSMTGRLSENGIVVCGGHDNGIYPAFLPSVQNGLKHLTHIFCAMSELRFEGGVRNVGLREYGLLDDNLTAEIIADNKHIPSALAKLILKCKGREKVAVVSDALRCAGMPADGKLYRLGMNQDESAQLFRVDDGVAVLADGSRFAGSITPVHQMVKNLIEAGVAVADAFRCATINPAQIIGAEHIGKIEKGYCADILVLNAKFDIEKIFINGNMYR